MNIESKVDKDNRMKIFQISGELDLRHVKNLKAEVMDSIEEEGWMYRLDMDEVTYLDSSGLGMLVFLKKELAKNQGKLEIVNLHEPVLNVFKLTKLEDFFGIS